MVQPTPDDMVMSKALIAFTKAREKVQKDYLNLVPPVRDDNDLYTRAILAGIKATVLAVRAHDALPKPEPTLRCPDHPSWTPYTTSSGLIECPCCQKVLKDAPKQCPHTNTQGRHGNLVCTDCGVAIGRTMPPGRIPTKEEMQGIMQNMVRKDPSPEAVEMALEILSSPKVKAAIVKIIEDDPTFRMERMRYGMRTTTLQ